MTAWLSITTLMPQSTKRKCIGSSPEMDRNSPSPTFPKVYLLSFSKKVKPSAVKWRADKIIGDISSEYPTNSFSQGLLGANQMGYLSLSILSILSINANRLAPKGPRYSTRLPGCNSLYLSISLHVNYMQGKKWALKSQSLDNRRCPDLQKEVFSRLPFPYGNRNLSGKMRK